MRLMCVGFLLLASAAWADPVSPYTAPQYTTTFPTPQPTAVLRPAATRPALAPPTEVALPPDVPHILDFQTSWGVALRGGMALPMGGSTASADSLGGMTGLDVFYHGTEKSSVDLMGLYASMPDTVGATAASPLSAVGLAVKLDYEVYRQDRTGVWLGLGVGYMDVQSTYHAVVQPITNPVTYTQSAQSTSGMTLLACVGAGYDITTQWSLNLEILAMSLDTMNGTSNNILAALPDIYAKWMY